MDYICEFHNLQYTVLLIAICVSIKHMNFLMYGVHYVLFIFIKKCCSMMEQQQNILNVMKSDMLTENCYSFPLTPADKCLARR